MQCQLVLYPSDTIGLDKQGYMTFVQNMHRSRPHVEIMLDGDERITMLDVLYSFDT